MMKYTFDSLENQADEKWIVTFTVSVTVTSTTLSIFSCLSVSATVNDPRNQTTAPSGSCNSQKVEIQVLKCLLYSFCLFVRFFRT